MHDMRICVCLYAHQYDPSTTSSEKYYICQLR